MNFILLTPNNISCLKTTMFNINIATPIFFELFSVWYILFFLPLCVFIVEVGFLWIAYSWILPFYPIWQSMPLIEFLRQFHVTINMTGFKSASMFLFPIYSICSLFLSLFIAYFWINCIYFMNAFLSPLLAYK